MLALVGLSRGSLAGLALACVGASLMCRGISGHCQLYKAMGVNTAEGGNLSPNAELVHQPRKVYPSLKGQRRPSLTLQAQIESVQCRVGKIIVHHRNARQ